MHKIAVLGLGSIGLRHSRNAINLGCQVMAYDPDLSRRALVESVGGVATDDRNTAIDWADAVVVASPTTYHARDLADTVAAGRHVFVEKPLAHCSDGIESVLDQADAKGLVVFPALNLRYHPCVVAVRRIIESGGIGRPLWGRLMFGSYLPSWRPHQDYRDGYAADLVGGGILLDDIHEFDLAMALLGEATTVAAVACQTGVLDIPTEDCADIVLRHVGGAQTSIHMDYVTRPRQRTAEIAGTDGMIVIDLNDHSYRQLAVSGDVVAGETFPGGYDADYLAEMTAFLDCLAGTARPACSAREALVVLSQVLMARKMTGLSQ
jgi:predicted dehydrogenase